MTYPFIAVGLAAVFILYVLYLLVIKRDVRQLKEVMPVGLFFLGVWIALYFVLVR